MELNALWPFINNAGASVLFVTFLILNHKRTELDHERQIQRDKDSQETIRQLMVALMDCTKTAVMGEEP